MNKYLILTFMVFILIISPSPVIAWSATNHHDIAQETYYSLPLDIQQKMNLSEMKDGSDDPDIKFLDFSYHVYPYNKEKADYWLNKGKINYEEGNYNYSSYCYGVATHYISDGFAGPHHESGTSRIHHTLYEIRAMFLKPEITYFPGNIDSIFQKNHSKTKKSWNRWLKEGDDINIQEDLNRAGSASYSAVINSINT